MAVDYMSEQTFSEIDLKKAVEGALAVERAKFEAEKEALIKNRDDILSEKKISAEKLKSLSVFEGVDPTLAEKVKGLSEKDLNDALLVAQNNRKALNEESLSALIAQRSEAEIKVKSEAFQTQLEAMKAERELALKEREQATADLNKYRIGAALGDAFAKAKIVPEATSAATQLAAANARWNSEANQIEFLSPDGNPLPSADPLRPNQPATVDEFVEKFKENHSYFFGVGSGSGHMANGANGSGSGSKNPWFTGNRMEKSKIRRENPEAAKQMEAAWVNAGSPPPKIE